MKRLLRAAVPWFCVVVSCVQLHARDDVEEFGVFTSPCDCEADNPTWTRAARTAAKCILIDLGAGSGESVETFVRSAHKCPGGDWFAILVEGDPRHTTSLQGVVAAHPGRVIALAGVAYMCEANCSFSTDELGHGSLYAARGWSSRGSVELPTVNVNRVLYEITIPQDFVVVKMDIAGAEWDILPCLAQATVASNVDVLSVIQNPLGRSASGTTESEIVEAKQTLESKGVRVVSRMFDMGR